MCGRLPADNIYIRLRTCISLHTPKAYILLGKLNLLCLMRTFHAVKRFVFNPKYATLRGCPNKSVSNLHTDHAIKIKHNIMNI